MKRVKMWIAAVAVAGMSLGCRNAHLGPDTGQAYRDALAAQRGSETAEGAPLDAEDARGVLDARRARKRSRRGSRARTASITTTSSSSSGATGAGLTSGSFGPSGRTIRLDAK